MTSLRALLLIPAALFLTNCKTEFKGTLAVRETTPFQIKKAVRELPPGDYQVKLSTSGEKNLTLELLGVEKKDQLKATFKIPKGINIPSNGKVQLLASESGQLVDLNGDATHSVVDGQVIEGWVDCTYNDSEYVCHGTGNDQYCGWEPMPKSGHQTIRYFYRYHDASLGFELTDPNSHISLGTAVSEASWDERIDTYTGDCR